MDMPKSWMEESTFHIQKLRDETVKHYIAFVACQFVFKDVCYRCVVIHFCHDRTDSREKLLTSFGLMN